MRKPSGKGEIHDLLGEALQEEKDTDEKLTEISQSVNNEAINQGEEDEEEMESEELEETPVRKSSSRVTAKLPKRGRTRAA